MKKLLLLLSLAWCGAASAQTYLGDYVLGDTVRCPWSTYKPSTGDSIARATAGTVTVYADNGAGNGFNTAESATGVTDTSAFDAKTGEHTAVVVASSGNGYAAGKDYAIMVQATTITDTATVTVNAWPCNFSIENRAGTRGRIKARGAMVTGSTGTVIQLATGTLPATNSWQGMSLHDVTTNEDATICSSTDGGAGNDTLSVAGLNTVPGATDSYEIVRTSIPAACISAPAGSGLPLIDALGAVVVSKIGASGASASSITDKAGQNLNTFFDNGGATATTPTVQGLYNNSGGNFTVEPNGSVTARCALAIELAHAAGTYQSSAATPPFTTTYKDPSGTTTRIVGTVTTTSLGGISISCPP
jgi:hypothetical protein